MYDKQVRRRRAVLALLVVVALILLTAYFGESAGSPLHTVQRGVIQVLSPIQEGASRALKPVRDLFGWFGDTLDAKKERDQLRAQRDRLLKEAVGYQSAMRRNAQLTALVTLGRSNGLDAYDKLTSTIIGRAPNRLFRDTLQIAGGSSDGVRVGAPVIAGAGLVGHVSTVTPATSIVTLITDQNSRVSARVLNGKGEPGLVRPSVGKPTDLLVQYLDPNARIRVGQVVVTSGIRSSRLESYYPPDIPIGQVTAASPETIKDDQQIEIAPYVDLRHLEYVQVLLGPVSATGERAEVGTP